MDFPIWVSVVAVGFLTFLSSILSASEAAFIGASKARIHRLAKQGNPKAGLVITLRARMERLLGSLLLTNILLNTAATAISTQVLTMLFGEAGTLYATIVMTLLITTYAEMLPKIYAIAHAEKTATFFARPLSVIAVIFSPITTVMQWIAKATLRIFGVSVDSNARSSSSLEELRGAIDLHNRSDNKAEEERAMLHSILDLGDVDVNDVMIHRKNIFTINASLPVDQILKEIVTSPFSRIPLWRENPDNIVGVLHARALLRLLRSKMDNVLSVDDILSVATPPWFIPESTTLFQQLTAFRKKREHFALVVDEYGVMLGVVTLEDIIEEIVGEISDEHDVALDGVWVRRDGSAIVEGTTTIRDLNRRFDWDLPDQDASTLAGLVLHESRIIPDVGQTFLIHGFRVKILKRIRNQITLIKINRLIDGLRDGGDCLDDDEGEGPDS